MMPSFWTPYTEGSSWRASVWTWFLLMCVLVFLARAGCRAVTRWRSWQDWNCRPAKTRAPVRDPFLGFDFVYDNLLSRSSGSRLAERHETYRRLGQTYSVQRWTYHTVHTCDSRNIKHMLATRFADFVLPDLRNRAIASFLGFGIFSINGHAWSRARAALRPGFSKQKVNGTLGMMEAHLNALWEHLPPDDRTIDLQPLFFELAMDVATEFLLGHSTSELQRPSLRSRNTQFVSDYMLCSEAVVEKLRLGPLQFLVRNGEAVKARARVYRYIDDFVEEAKQWRVWAEADGKYDILRELEEMTPDHKTLREQILHILLASRDTVACLLSNLIFVLSKRPSVQSRLREEVLRCAGTECPTVEQLHSMRYLRWCVNESLRLHPVIPTNAREAVVDTTLPFGGGPDGNSPLFIAKGMLVMYNTYTMHRNPEVYGQDADEYVPDRWESKRPGWDFLPFNGGPRACIGQQFALIETYYVICRILQRFSSIESRDDREWEEKEALATTCKHGALVGLSRCTT